MLINSWALEDEERRIARARVKSLLSTYRRGTMDRNELNRYFTEWSEIAARLHRGAEMLDNREAVQERSKQHMKELEDLYALLLRLLGMYDEFFKRMLASSPGHHERAQSKIMDILNGKAA